MIEVFNSIGFKEIVSLFTFIFAGYAAFISWQNYRLSGKKRWAEFKQQWVSDLRLHIASLFFEFENFEKQGSMEKLSKEFNYIYFFLDNNKKHHKEFKNAILEIYQNCKSKKPERLYVKDRASKNYRKALDATRNFISTEQDAIEFDIARPW